MKNFEYKNPTKILFGKGQIANLDKEIPKNAKILLLYGGGSIKKNGIYEQVLQALNGREIVEFGGVPANPEYEILMDAVAVIKEQNLDYILAVGGGSVIDGAKFISATVKYEGDEPWNLLAKREEIKEALPFGTVLTLPATGSEMNPRFVVSRRATKQKLSSASPLLFPQVSVLDPTVIQSLPERQIVNGVADSFMHTLEQYMTYPAGGFLQDRFAEGILQTLTEVGQRVIKNPSDYESASNFMWCCTLALNDLIAQGVPSDWGVHAIGHELTALHGIDHARTLAIVAPRYYELCFEYKKEKLAQYAERIWGVTSGTIEEKAMQGIAKTEEFYQSLGIATKLSAYTADYEGTAEEIARRFTERGWLGLGEHRNVTPDDVALILKSAY
ncbi:MAG: iron-containing alcohol dehydrogenase [Flavobacteriaceae bacterium]|nr:iron-containing alcohol dehydrogenase [Flavobacteriaceae bacterium]